MPAVYFLVLWRHGSNCVTDLAYMTIRSTDTVGTRITTTDHHHVLLQLI